MIALTIPLYFSFKYSNDRRVLLSFNASFLVIVLLASAVTIAEEQYLTESARSWERMLLDHYPILKEPLMKFLLDSACLYWPCVSLHAVFFLYGCSRPQCQGIAISVVCITWASVVVFLLSTIPLYLDPPPWIGESLMFGFFLFLLPLWVMGVMTFFVGVALRSSIIHRAAPLT